MSKLRGQQTSSKKLFHDAEVFYFWLENAGKGKNQGEMRGGLSTARRTVKLSDASVEMTVFKQALRHNHSHRPLQARRVSLTESKERPA